ncbi:Card1-like endonuclease domain-containing protein [Pectobacterium polaris]|uniref:Card1-like endonuclease domain-containing protein n=1 Tax=Pectobacterium polaris TaxID=2042057 RepID=UPI0032E47C8D
MKKYLMTWYGITDFSASLGLEQTTGPVLGALLAEDYTDVIILGFTHLDKSEHKADEFQQKIAGVEGSDPDAARQFIDLFSNTGDAHHHFNEWLKKQLRDAGKKVDVRFHPVGLTHLNDTEGIYEAATQSLNAVAASEGEKLVTLYLSPGTPVMAFVWAFAALRHTTLKKRLIASSQPRKPPEEIVLPNEWLEWHGRQVRTTNEEFDQYDAIFHLFGEQRIPNLLGVIQFSSRKHIFVNSEQFPADVMKQFLGEAEYGEIAVDPYDPENVRTTILELIAKMSAEAKIGFNLTGGTKLMYAGALAACRKVNATPFYFNSRNNQVVYLNDFKTVETKRIPSVETFIQLNSNNLFISKAGHWSDIPGIESTDRKSLTNELWQAHSKISRLYRELSRYNDSFQPFELHNGDIYAKLSKDKCAKISIGPKHFEFKEWPDFAKYLSGGWFEEYTFMKLQPLVDAGLIKDMRIGLEVSFKEDDADKSSSSFSAQLSNLLGDTYQELDITFTDGRRLYVIECKAGNVNSEHVIKLQNIVRYFGGIEGRAILASCFYPKNKVVRKKIDDSKNLQSVSGNGLFRQLEEMIQPGGRHR